MARYKVLKKDLDFINEYFSETQKYLQDENLFLSLKDVFQFYQKSYSLVFPLSCSYGWGHGISGILILSKEDNLGDYFVKISEMKNLDFLEPQLVDFLKQEKGQHCYLFSFHHLEKGFQTLFYSFGKKKNPPCLVDSPKETIQLTIGESLIILEEIFQVIESGNEKLIESLKTFKILKKNIPKIFEKEKIISKDITSQLFWKDLPIRQNGFWN